MKVTKNKLPIMQKDADSKLERKGGDSTKSIGNSPQNLDEFWRAIYYEINK